MATVLSETPASEAEMVVTFPKIDWDDFEAVVRMKGDRRRPRLIYGEGRLTLVSPSQRHEQGIDRLDTLIKEVCVGLGIPCTPTRATLFRRRDLDHGIEGDGTYYLASEPAIRDKEIDLDADPPPDLAVEVEITHPAADALETWRRLGVPEVWVHDGRRHALRILLLDEHVRYVEAPAGRAFPFLAAVEILGWVEQPRDEPETLWQGRLREWVRGELAGRLDRDR